jgi:hypothetical protein
MHANDYKFPMREGLIFLSSAILQAVVVIEFFLVHTQLAGRAVGGARWQAAYEGQNKDKYSWGANHSLKIENMADDWKLFTDLTENRELCRFKQFFFFRIKFLLLHGTIGAIIVSNISSQKKSLQRSFLYQKIVSFTRYKKRQSAHVGLYPTLLNVLIFLILI